MKDKYDSMVTLNYIIFLRKGENLSELSVFNHVR